MDSFKRTETDLSYIEPHRQFQCFVEEVCCRFSQNEAINISDRRDFPARFVRVDVGDSRCTLAFSPGVLFERTAEAIRKDQRDDLFISYVLAGQGGMDNSGRIQCIERGGVMIHDHAQPITCEAKTVNGVRGALAVSLKRQDYRDPAAMSALLDPKRLARHSLAPLLAMSMEQLAASMKRSNEGEIATLLGVVESVVLLIAQDDTVQRKDSGSVITFQLIEADISRQLWDSELSLDGTAQRFGISVRQIQRIMARQDTCFSDLVRDKRLVVAMAWLRDDKFAKNTIEEIAYGCGFLDLSTFYRAFRSKFKCTPGDIRRQNDRLLKK